MVLGLILAGVLVSSLVSLIGAFFLLEKEKWLKDHLGLFVSFAAGGLLGAAFIDILPETLEEGAMPTEQVFVLTLFGIAVFFFLETFLYWRHAHHHSHAHKHHRHVKGFTYLNLVGDGVHNMIDGAVIAVSFLTDIYLGITVTLAVIFHEIPQELGDLSILIYGGFKKSQALWWNFLSALMSVVGAVLAFLFTTTVESFSGWLLPLAAGGFIYIATADLIPELQKEENLKNSFKQFVLFVIGILAIFFVTQYFHI